MAFASGRLRVADMVRLGLVMNAVGIPPGVYNVVHGFGPDSAGEFLTRHPGVNGITFTGETRTGEAIMAAAARGVRPVSFELGGKNAGIVFADADFDKAVAGENAARSTKNGAVSYQAKVIGERPAGATPHTAEIVALTAGAVKALGYKPTYQASSTDSNIPMSLGIPALTIGAGFRGGRAHALDEWIDVTKDESLRGMQVGLAALLAVAGGGAFLVSKKQKKKK